MEIAKVKDLILYVRFTHIFRRKEKKVRTKKNREVKQEKTNNVIPAPLFLSATSGDIDGEIDLAWEPVPNANAYIVQKCSGSGKPLHWVNLDVIAKSSYTVSRLKSRRLYRFRVAAVTGGGKSLWSTPVLKKAP